MIDLDVRLSAVHDQHVQVLQLQGRYCDGDDGGAVCERGPRLPRLQCGYVERLELAACTSPS